MPLVELKKFKPQTFSEKKEGTRGIDNFMGRRLQVLWLRFLTEINDETREVPAELLENAEVSEALEIVERAAFDDGEMRAYDKFWDAISSRKSEINAVKREADKAIADAKKEAKEKMLDAARTMKADGMSVDLLAKYTGLSNEQIDCGGNRGTII